MEILLAAFTGRVIDPAKLRLPFRGQTHDFNRLRFGGSRFYGFCLGLWNIFRCLAEMRTSEFGGADGRFFDLRGGQSAEIVRGFESERPGIEIDFGKLLSGSALKKYIERLALIYPFASVSGRLDEPAGIHLEYFLILFPDVFGNLLYFLDASIMILQFSDHLIIPEIEFFQIRDQVVVDDDEVAALVGLHVDILVDRFDRRDRTYDIRSGCCRRDR